MLSRHGHGVSNLLRLLSVDGDKDGRDGAPEPAPRTAQADEDAGYDGVDEAVVPAAIVARVHGRGGSLGLLSHDYHIGRGLLRSDGLLLGIVRRRLLLLLWVSGLLRWVSGGAWLLWRVSGGARLRRPRLVVG